MVLSTRCISFLWPLVQITTNVVTQNNRDVLPKGNVMGWGVPIRTLGLTHTHHYT